MKKNRSFINKFLIILIQVLLIITFICCDGGEDPVEPADPASTTRKVEFVDSKYYYQIGNDITFKIEYSNFNTPNNSIKLKISDMSALPIVDIVVDTRNVTGTGNYTWTVSSNLFQEFYQYAIYANYYETNTGTTDITTPKEYFEVTTSIPTTDVITITNTGIYNCNDWGSPNYSVDIDVDLGSLPKNDSYLIQSFLYKTENNEYTELKFNSIIFDQNSNLPNQFQVNLEFGGSMPSGTYKLDAQISQLVSGNWSVKDTEQGLPVTVWDYTGSYNAIKDIEYDFHPNHDFRNGKEDEITQKLKTAFDPSLTQYTLKYTSTALNHLDQEIFAHNDNIALYAMINDWDYNAGDDDLHILFMGYIEDEYGNPDYSVGGQTGIFSNQSDPSNYKFSYIYMDAINNWGTNTDYVYLAIMHELGHQRAKLVHASGANPDKSKHNSPFCTMNQGITFKGDNDNDPNNDGPPQPNWSFYNNPHFCGLDCSLLSTFTWKGAK